MISNEEESKLEPLDASAHGRVNSTNIQDRTHDSKAESSRKKKKKRSS